MAQTMSLSSFGTAAATLLGFTLLYSLAVHVSTRRLASKHFTRDLPNVGTSKYIWGRWGGLFRSISNSQQMVDTGYNEFTKWNRLFVLPTLAAGPVVILPSSHLDILNRSEAQVSGHPRFEIIQPWYTMARDKKVCESTIAAGFGLVWRYLTKPRDVEKYLSVVDEEFSSSFDEYWGANSGADWVPRKVFEMCAQVVARTANRMYFGLPLSRNEDLLNYSRKYAEAVFGAAAMISTFPTWARPIIGRILAFPAQRYLASCKKLLIPYIESRLEETHKGRVKHDDLLQTLIIDTQKYRPQELNALHLTYSLLAINQSSIYGTASGLTNLILDLYSSDKCEETIELLREECERVARKFSGSLASISALDELHGLDSCIRESMRVSGFNTVAVMREVTALEGIQLHDVGTVPAGVRIGAPIQSIHFDAAFYPSPVHFDAFRFSRTSEAEEPTSTTNRKGAHSAANISKEYLPWGYGRHACPGRWLAVAMMKLAMAHVITRYEVQPLQNRLKSTALLNVLLPPMEAAVMVRPRSKEEVRHN